MTASTALTDRVLAIGGGRLSVRYSRRTVWVCLVLLVATVVVGFLSIATGPTHVAFREVLPALFGSGQSRDVFVAQDVRLPRFVLGVLAGAALGVGGALFQSFARNPLGSPDIIGFDTGAATGAVIAIVSFGATAQFVIAGAAIAGGLLTACLVLTLSVRGGLQPFRLILIGIGVGAVLSAVNTFILEFASLADNEHVALWLTGTLTGATMSQAGPVALALVVLVVVAGIAGRGLRVLEMGDAAAISLGLRIRRIQMLTLLVGIGLTATAISATGPIAFVSLAAPQLARRLTRADGPTVAASLVMGAFLLTASDFLAQRILPEQELPVGIVTGVVGGLYLAWMLGHEWKKNRT